MLINIWRVTVQRQHGRREEGSCDFVSLGKALRGRMGIYADIGRGSIWRVRDMKEEP